MLALSGCCSWAAAALLLLLFGAHAFPIGDSSGEEEFGEDPSSRTPAAGRVQLNARTELALWLQGTAARWNQEMNNPESVSIPSPDTQKTLAAQLREQRAWNMIVIKHFILQDFTLFMETTSRVIRLL
ncbi:hypothetical protein Chor_008623 [Crotalus horridus]